MSSRWQLLRIATRIFKRDCKRGDLLILLFAMTVAMVSVSVIYLFIDRIESAMTHDVADVLGADLVVTSPRQLPQSWLDAADKQQLARANSVEFSSVLFARGKLQLASIKAVSDNFPLNGSLQVASTLEGAVKAVNSKPPSGQLWLEPRLYNLLGLKSAQPVELGYTTLTSGGVLVRQPGQSSSLFNIAPTAIMSIDDLAATRIIQPGSRVNYRYLFSGGATAVKSFAAKISKEKNSSQSIVSVFDESPLAGSALVRAKKYIGLSSLLTMLLLGVAIAMSASRYARKQFDMSALMRCFGLNNNQVLSIFCCILGYICILGTLLGGLLGIGFQQLLVSTLGSVFFESLPSANYSVLLIPMLASIILLLGFSLPPLLQLRLVPPMRVLHQQLQPMGVSSGLIYLSAAISLVVVMWLQMGDLKLLAIVLIGLGFLVLVFALLAVGLLRLMKALARGKRNTHAAINFSLRQLDANKGVTLLHLLAFSITIFVIGLIVLIRLELIDKWQQSLGENTPNHFMVNVKPDEVNQLKQFFSQHQLTFAGLYPMVRGRISGVNGLATERAVPAQALQHNSLRRELNISWSAELPQGNKLVEGPWGWPQQVAGQPAEAQISIEAQTAKALGLAIGDRLEFTIGAEVWSAKIINIRSVDWQTFTPNFYIIANPGSLKDFHATYITSFFMPGEKKFLLSRLVKNYPGVTLIEFDLILKQVQSIIGKVSTAIELIMVFVVAAGIALLWAAMEHTFDVKSKQAAILRTLGASRKFISRCFRFEYLWLALLSSIMALLAVELVSYLLYQQVFNIAFEFHWAFWWLMPSLTLLLMLTGSWRGVNKVTEPSPLSLLG